MSPSPLITSVERAAPLLKDGGLVAFPTETVYGLGADARNSAAVRRIYATKGRPPSNPLIVHVHSVEQIFEYADISRSFDPAIVVKRLDRLSQFWPGPLSVIVPRGTNIAEEVSAGGTSVAFRIPSHPIARELLKLCNAPIAAPSANRSEYVSPTTVLHVVSDIERHLNTTTDGIIDGGPCPIGIESTVISLLDEQPRLLRPGSITREQLSQALGVELLLGLQAPQTPDAPLLSPGLLAKHYAPHTPVRFISHLETVPQLPERIGVILFTEPTALLYAADTADISTGWRS